MLYNLLSTDKSRFQVPKIWQMYHMIHNPTPSVSKSQRRKAYRASIEMVQTILDDMLSALYSSHPPPSETLEDEGPEEDVLVLMHCFPEMMSPYKEWMLNEKPAKAYYEYHHNYFKMLQLDNDINTNACWLWKTPYHALFINSLIEIYPDARFIITHRHPFEVIPSTAKLYSTFLRIRWMPGTLLAKEVGRIALRVSKTMINRMEAAGIFTKNNPNVIHIHYSNLMDNPVECVRKIYDHFGLSPISAELYASFQMQSKVSPHEKYGRMNYSLNEFGLTKDEIETEFDTYIRWLDTI